MTIKTTIFPHRPHVSLTRFSFCLWRHNRLLITSQWPDNCDAITWIVISNSLDIDFIHGDIHGRSCKKIVIHNTCTSIMIPIVDIVRLSWCRVPSTMGGPIMDIEYRIFLTYPPLEHWKWSRLFTALSSPHCGGAEAKKIPTAESSCSVFCK